MGNLTISKNGIPLAIDLVPRKRAIEMLGINSGGYVDEYLHKNNIEPIVKIPAGSSRSMKFYLKEDIAVLAVIRELAQINKIIGRIEDKLLTTKPLISIRQAHSYLTD